MRLKRVLLSALVPAGTLALLSGVGATEAPTRPLPSATDTLVIPLPEQHEGITLPAGKPTPLSFKTIGLIREVTVKPGDRIKKGQELAILEDRQEQIERDIYKLEAESEVALRVAEEALRVRALKLARIEIGFKRQVNTDEEYEIAQAEKAVAVWEVEKAKIELQQKRLQLQRQETILDNMRIRAKADGIVQDVVMKAGEICDPQKPVLVVVQNDPLWVDVHVPTRQALALWAQERKTGQKPKVQVLYKDLDEAPVEATVIFYDPLADASAGVQRVRLELPNPDDKPAGLQVLVKVPQPNAAVSAKSE